MSTVFDDDILIHHVMVPGLDGDGFTNPEAMTLRADIATLKSRPVITALIDIPDVSGDPEDGQALIYDATSDEWRPGKVTGTIRQVVSGGTPVKANVGTIQVGRGLRASDNDSDYALIEPVYGTSANTIAQGNHTHALPTTTHTPIAAQGYMGSGTRPLASTSVVLPAGKQCKVEAKIDPLQIRGGDPGPCYYRLIITIDGNARSQPNNTSSYWAVQGVPKDAKWTHERVINGTGAAITVSASIAWVSGGGGFYTDAGDLVVTVTPNR